MIWKALRQIITVLTVLLFAADSVSADDQRIVPRVDERSELLGIVFHLAGCFEYNQTKIEKYKDDIENYFAAHKKDAVVILAGKLRQDAHVGFEAPMKMAVSLSSPPGLMPVVLLTQDPEDRWGEKNASEFVEKLREFYTNSRFRDFFSAHETLYKLAESRFQDMAGKLDKAWYKRFFGDVSIPVFNVILNLVNGPSSYGADFSYPDGHKELFAVIGCDETDKTGNPRFEPDNLLFIVHEFNHSFVNPIVEAHSKDFACAQPVFDVVAQDMSARYYGSCTGMLCEALVRAGELMYMETHGAGEQEIRGKILEEQSCGFVWIDELYELLRHYQLERSKYPTLDAFIPKIVEFYRALAPRIKEKLAAYDQQCPHVVSTEPVGNHSSSVDARTREIIVHFDKALDPQYNQVVATRAGMAHYPVIKSEFLPGNKSLKITVKLKKSWNFEMRLDPYYFRAPNGYRLVDYKFEFKTK